MKTHKPTLAESVKRATLGFKSPECIARVRRKMAEEGFSEEYIEKSLAGVKVLPDLTIKKI